MSLLAKLEERSKQRNEALHQKRDLSIFPNERNQHASSRTNRCLATELCSSSCSDPALAASRSAGFEPARVADSGSAGFEPDEHPAAALAATPPGHPGVVGSGAPNINGAGPRAEREPRAPGAEACNIGART